MDYNIENSLSQINQKHSKNYFKVRAQILSNQLKYLQKVHEFTNEIEKYRGNLDDLHYFLIENSTYAVSSIKGSLNSSAGIMRNFAEILSAAEIEPQLHAQVEISFFDEGKFNKETLFSEIKDCDISNNTIEVLDRTIQDIGGLSVRESFDVFDLKRLDLIYDAADALSNTAKEYEKYLYDEQNYWTDGGGKEDGQLSTLIGMTMLLVAGGVLIGHDIPIPNPTSVCAGIGLLGTAAIEWPGIDHLNDWPPIQN